MVALPLENAEILVTNGYVPYLYYNSSAAHKTVNYSYTVTEDGTLTSQHPAPVVSETGIFSNGQEFDASGYCSISGLTVNDWSEFVTYTTASPINEKGEVLNIYIEDGWVKVYNTVTGETESICIAVDCFALNIGEVTYSHDYKAYYGTVWVCGLDSTKQSGASEYHYTGSITLGFDATFTTFENQKYKVTETTTTTIYGDD